MKNSVENKIESSTNSFAAFYQLDSDNANQIVSDNKISNIDFSKLISTAEYNQQLIIHIQKAMIPAIMVFFVFLAILSVLLFQIFVKISRKEKLKIVDDLNLALEGESSIPDDFELECAIQTIKLKFEENLNDYKRLNSFLSHEQRNTISILQNKLTLSNETEYLPNLSSISDNIDDVLTLSEGVSKKTDNIVDIALICAHVCDNYTEVYPNIIYEFDDEGCTEIYGKERWIYRAVSNLVSNAVKYGNSNPIEVIVINKNNCVIISVRDQGIGISKDQSEQIFEHNYRINELSKSGYGIGLSLVSHVCDLCGGFAFVESRKNVGSTFYLSFPAVNAQ